MWFDGGSVCIGGARGVTCFQWQGFSIYVGSATLLLALVLGVLLWDARRIPTPSEAARRANRHATLASIVGIAMLVIVLMWLALAFIFGARPSDGRVVALLPALAGACLLAAQAVGQLTWPRPSGSHREAELAPRGVAEVSPLWPRRLGIVWAGASLLLLGVFALVADGPRSLTRDAGRYAEAIGPYPGWYYGVPMALAVVATVGATELVLRMITARPAVAGVSAEWDLHLRRRSAAHVSRGIQLVLAITVAGILTAAGWGHLSLGHDFMELSPGQYAAEGSSAQRYLGTALLIAALCVVLVGLAGVVLPQRRGRRKGPVAVGATVTP
jgi:hypothetical protein